MKAPNMDWVTFFLFYPILVFLGTDVFYFTVKELAALEILYLKNQCNEITETVPCWYIRQRKTEDFLLASKNCFLFFFLKLMWRFKRRKQIRRGYPVSFKQMFIGLPENITKIDAVYERPIDNCIIFFTGNFMLSVIRVLLTNFLRKIFF